MPFSRRLLDPEWKVPTRTPARDRAPARAEPTSAELAEQTLVAPAQALASALAKPPPAVPGHVALRVVGRSHADPRPTPLVGVRVEILLGDRVAAHNRTDPSGATWLPHGEKLAEAMVVVRGDDEQIVARRRYTPSPFVIEVGESPSVGPAYARGRATLARLDAVVARGKEVAARLAAEAGPAAPKDTKEPKARPSASRRTRKEPADR